MIEGFHDRIKLFLEKNLPRYVNKDTGRKGHPRPALGIEPVFPVGGRLYRHAFVFNG